MTKTDFSIPQRMSPGAFFIIFTKQFLRFLGPLSLVFVYHLMDSSSERGIGLIGETFLMLGICMATSLIWALFSYIPKKYYIKDGNIIFIHGILDRENTVVPLDRVHSLRTEKGIMFRLLDMRGIVFDTLATRQQEIELIIDEYDWKRLLSLIDDDGQAEEIHSIGHRESRPSSTVRYPVRNLLAAALCQNHLKGFAVLGSFIAFMYGTLDDISDNASLSVMEWMETFFETLIVSPFKIVIFLASVYVIVLLLWLGKILLRYFDTTMSHEKDLLIFTYGMLTRSSCRFFFDKICTIWIKRNFLEKKFGFSTMMLRQALNATAQKEDDNMTLYGTDSSSFYLKWWLGDDYATAEEIFSIRSGKGVFYRHVLFRAILAIIVLFLLFDSQLYLWMIIPSIYLLILFPKGIFAMRHSGIDLKAGYLIIHNGAFAEIDNYIKYSDIEVVGIRRSPFTRWSNRVSISVSTSGTTFSVRSIKEEAASLIREFLLLKAEE
ncbi:MAG: PH domain-containing protein [Muribaculaceae bacterium]|nr:PH domain-containing protein [Muribaculaceae bacterium]